MQGKKQEIVQDGRQIFVNIKIYFATNCLNISV